VRESRLKGKLLATPKSGDTANATNIQMGKTRTTPTFLDAAGFEGDVAPISHRWQAES
jgi:hypothetical protein